MTQHDAPGVALAERLDFAGTSYITRGQRAKDVLVGPSGHALFPGGFNRATFSVGAWCPMAIEGDGYLLIDELGNELIDLNNNFTSLIHGHAHPDIVEAGVNAIRRGASFGLPNHFEVRHARALLSRFTTMDQVRYANSGTEAVLAAVRLARASTGRDQVVFLENAYHGLSESALATGRPYEVRGIPDGIRRHTERVAPNDLDALEALFAASGDRIAAIVLDLIPNRAGLVRISDAFASRARELTAAHGALLVVDEVISARMGYGGYAAARGLSADVTVLGKLIGGGLPVGAVLGTADVMAFFDPGNPRGIEMGGTFSGNPVTMASGVAALEALGRDDIDRLNSLGESAREDLARLLEGRPWEVRGDGSLLRAYCVRPGLSTPAVHLAVWHAAYARGLLTLPNGLAALSTPMTPEVVAEAVSRLAAAIIEVDDRVAESSPSSDEDRSEK